MIDSFIGGCNCYVNDIFCLTTVFFRLGSIFSLSLSLPLSFHSWLAFSFVISNHIETKNSATEFITQWRQKQLTSKCRLFFFYRSLFLHSPQEQETIPWFKVRECLLLVLQSRVILKHLIKARLKDERTRLGALSVNEIQNLLKAQKDEQEGDWISGE
jgi:hypothetical protein